MFIDYDFGARDQVPIQINLIMMRQYQDFTVHIQTRNNNDIVCVVSVQIDPVLESHTLNMFYKRQLIRDSYYA